MNVLYSNHTGSTRFTYHTDTQKPNASGKYLAGFADSEDEIQSAVKKGLGHSTFTLTLEPQKAQSEQTKTELEAA